MMNRLFFNAIATSGCLLVAVTIYAQEGKRPTPPVPPKPPVYIESADNASAITITGAPSIITGVPGRSEDLAFTFVEATGKERKLEAESRELLAQYRKTTDGGERERIEGELRKVLADQFSAKQSNREKEIERLEAEIERLREVHQRRNEQSERIIDDRLQQLLRDASGLGWGDDASLNHDSHTGFSYRMGWPEVNPLELTKRVEVDIKRVEADAARAAANAARDVANSVRKRVEEKRVIEKRVEDEKRFREEEDKPFRAEEDEEVDE